MIVECCNSRFGRQNIHPTQKNYFNEIVANALCDNIDIVNFGLGGYGGQKHPSVAKNDMRDLIY